MPAHDRPTIRTVADHAGVSKSLVSLVLQGSDRVRAETRDRVLQAIDELGYAPNAWAQSLGARRSRLVGVVMDDLRNPWYIDCLDALAGRLVRAGRRVLVLDGRINEGVDDALVASILSLGVEGIVAMGSLSASRDLERAMRSIPTVAAAGRDIDIDVVDVIAADDVDGARLAVRHLAERGHRRIAHIAGWGPEVARLRRRGFEEACQELDVEVAGIEPEDMTEDGGHRAARRLLDGANPPTAVFAVNDVSAIGVLSAARELGLSVPGDLAVIGFDDIPSARSRLVDLSTIDIANAAVGARAAEALLARIEDPGRPRTVDLLPPTVLERGSTAAG